MNTSISLLAPSRSRRIVEAGRAAAVSVIVGSSTLVPRSPSAISYTFLHPLRSDGSPHNSRYCLSPLGYPICSSKWLRPRDSPDRRAQPQHSSLGLVLEMLNLAAP